MIHFVSCITQQQIDEAHTTALKAFVKNRHGLLCLDFVNPFKAALLISEKGDLEKMKARNWNFALPDTELVKLDTICRELCISRSTWYQGVKDGKFPKQIKLTERTSAWKTNEIRELINRSDV